MIQQVSPMKQTKKLRFSLMLAISSLAAGCGGGGDNEAGSPTVFSVVPTTVSFKAPVGTPAGVCLGGGTQTVFIYGGAAPYKIDNTSPDAVNVDKTEVGERGGSFTITVRGGCLTTVPIVVVDKLNKIVTFTINNGPAGA